MTLLDQSDRRDLKIVACVGLALILFLAGFVVFSSYMEAAAFNRVTGKNVSTWDAMWVELRVQEPSR